jgi:hypothetical protein
VTRPNLYQQLNEIRLGSESGVKLGSYQNQVVFIYYRGREKVGEAGNSFETAPGSELSSDWLVKELADTPGRHVLLFDVDHVLPDPPRPVDKIDGWRNAYPEAQAHTGVVRYAWWGKGSAPPAAQLITALREVPHQLPCLRRVAAVAGGPPGKFPGGERKVLAHLPPDWGLPPGGGR